ncbi:MAG: hypothetical protein AAF387_02215 [Pseudomonadota bacterium]
MNFHATSTVLVGFVLIFSVCSADVKAKIVSDERAEAELKFEERADGKCHILSEGGKLMVVHNTHDSLPIKFRFIRYFADVRQRGRATGTVVPGEAPVKLGCTQVDGRPQHWKIERANFTEPLSDSSQQN